MAVPKRAAIDVLNIAAQLKLSRTRKPCASFVRYVPISRRATGPLRHTGGQTGYQMLDMLNQLQIVSLGCGFKNRRDETMNLNELQLALATRPPNNMGFARTAGVTIPFLGYTPCPINFDEYEVSDTEALKVLGEFLNLSNADRLGLSAPVFDHYTASVRDTGGVYADEEDLLGGKTPPASPEDVWRLVTGSDLLVRKENGILYVLVVSDCEWDLENGFCMIFRHGKELVRVGDLNYGPLEPSLPSQHAGIAGFEALGETRPLPCERM